MTNNDISFADVTLPTDQWLCVVRALENCSGFPSASEQQSVSNARDMILTAIKSSNKGA